MRYEEFCKTHDYSNSDPLEAWVDDPNTTDEDFLAHIGPIPTAEDWARAEAEAKARGEEPPTFLFM